MWIESLQPLRVRRLVDVVDLRPGLPVEFSEAEGQRLLQHVPEKVTVVHPLTDPLFLAGSMVLVRSQSVEPWAASVAFLLPQFPGGTTQAGWWYCVEAGARWAFVHESLLDGLTAKNVTMSP